MKERKTKEMDSPSCKSLLGIYREKERTWSYLYFQSQITWKICGFFRVTTDRSLYNKTTLFLKGKKHFKFK